MCAAPCKYWLVLDLFCESGRIREQSDMLMCCLTVVNGCAYLQRFWHLLGYEDVELFVDETVSLAWYVEHTVVQVV